jgi:hypothetical protein
LFPHLENSKADPANLQIVLYFQDLTGTGPPPVETLEIGLGSWNRSALQNNMREFLFKFRNNQLPLNNRVNAYDMNVDPRCSFCKIIDNQSTTRESFDHLFLNCPVTRNLLSRFTSNLVPVPDMDLKNLKTCTGMVLMNKKVRGKRNPFRYGLL